MVRTGNCLCAHALCSAVELLFFLSVEATASTRGRSPNKHGNVRKRTSFLFAAQHTFTHIAAAQPWLLTEQFPDHKEPSQAAVEQREGAREHKFFSVKLEQRQEKVFLCRDLKSFVVVGAATMRGVQSLPARIEARCCSNWNHRQHLAVNRAIIAEQEREIARNNESTNSHSCHCLMPSLSSLSSSFEC